MLWVSCVKSLSSQTSCTTWRFSKSQKVLPRWRSMEAGPTWSGRKGSTTILRAAISRQITSWVRIDMVSARTRAWPPRRCPRYRPARRARSPSSARDAQRREARPAHRLLEEEVHCLDQSTAQDDARRIVEVDDRGQPRRHVAGPFADGLD